MTGNDTTRLAADIRSRLNSRRMPAIGVCQACGHQQEMMPSWQPIPSSLAEEQWKCQQCGGQISVTVTIGGLGPTADDDVATLLAQLDAQAETLARLTEGLRTYGHHYEGAGDEGTAARDDRTG
jgi:hypothetical protein